MEDVHIGSVQFSGDLFLGGLDIADKTNYSVVGVFRKLPKILKL